MLLVGGMEESSLPAGSPLPVSHDVVPVLQGPAYQCVDVGKQGAGTRRQGIFHPRGDFGICLAGDVTVVFQHPQGYGQHLLRYVGNFPLQFLEPYRLFAGLGHGVYDQKRPFVEKPGQYVPDGAVGE